MGGGGYTEGFALVLARYALRRPRSVVRTEMAKSLETLTSMTCINATQRAVALKDY
jgi:hypothetical protein